MNMNASFNIPGVLPGVSSDGLPGGLPGVLPKVLPKVSPGGLPDVSPKVSPGVLPGVSPKVSPGVLPGGLPEDPEAKAKAEAEEREALIEQLQQELDSLHEELLTLQKPINEIYAKYEKQNPDIKLSELPEEERKKLDEYDDIYNNKYREIIQKIEALKEEGQEGLFATFVIAPIKTFFHDIADNIKNGTAKVATGTFKFWTDVAAKSMEEMKESLAKIQEVKAQIAAAGKIAEHNATAGLPGSGLSGLPGSGLPGSGLPGSGQEQAAGGRYSNIKEVQKGGAAAAKRAQDSINQFLSSSVTSSHILKMVKRKTKAKRKRNDKRYSRKRAKK